MTPEDRNTLLAYARTCVEVAMEREPLPALKHPPESLLTPNGVFVTLRSDGKLRGCLGILETKDPLWKCVGEMAEASACRDYRFLPLRPGEPFTVEISILSPSFSIAPDQIHVGKHGLIVECSGHRGVLLPHVAIENKWTPSQFLEQTILKANLSLKASHEEDFSLKAFTTVLISEI